MKRVLSFLLLQAIFLSILLSQLGSVDSERRLATPTSYPTTAPTKGPTARSCTNHRKDNDDWRGGTETDIDCGGDDCPPCELGKQCGPYGGGRVSNEGRHSDCASGYCASIGSGFYRCQAPPTMYPTRSPTMRPTTVRCTNGKKDGSESDIDCGGYYCHSCELGQRCETHEDCKSNTCSDWDAWNMYGKCTTPFPTRSPTAPTSRPTRSPTFAPTPSPYWIEGQTGWNGCQGNLTDITDENECKEAAEALGLTYKGYDKYDDATNGGPSYPKACWSKNSGKPYGRVMWNSAESAGGLTVKEDNPGLLKWSAPLCHRPTEAPTNAPTSSPTATPTELPKCANGKLDKRWGYTVFEGVKSDKPYYFGYDESDVDCGSPWRPSLSGTYPIVEYYKAGAVLPKGADGKPGPQSVGEEAYLNAVERNPNLWVPEFDPGYCSYEDTSGDNVTYLWSYRMKSSRDCQTAWGGDGYFPYKANGIRSPGWMWGGYDGPSYDTWWETEGERADGIQGGKYTKYTKGHKTWTPGSPACQRCSLGKKCGQNADCVSGICQGLGFLGASDDEFGRGVCVDRCQGKTCDVPGFKDSVCITLPVANWNAHMLKLKCSTHSPTPQTPAPSASPTAAPSASPTKALPTPSRAPTAQSTTVLPGGPTQFSVELVAGITAQEFKTKEAEIHSAMDIYFLGTDKPATLGIISTVTYHTASARRKLTEGSIEYSARVIDGASDDVRKQAQQRIAASYQDACRECSQSISIAGLQMTPTTSSAEEKATVPIKEKQEEEQTKILGIPLTTPVIIGASVGVVAIAGVAYKCVHYRHKATSSLQRSVSERAAGIEIGQLQRQASQVSAENPGNPVLNRQISNTDSVTGIV